MLAALRPHAQQPERLMRYRFDSALQARRHVHVVERRQLLFFPDPFLDVREGQPVQLELCFTGSEQTLTVRGEVHSLETGTLRGAWLELYSIRLFDGLQTACGTPRRIFRRLTLGSMIQAHRPGLPPALVRIADVSAGGVRVLGAEGRWGPGEEIVLSELSGGPPLRGLVIWSHDGEIAVKFLRADATTRRNAVKLVDAALQRWTDARESRHPAACGCTLGGALFEPLRPRAAHRRMEGL